MPVDAQRDVDVRRREPGREHQVEQQVLELAPGRDRAGLEDREQLRDPAPGPQPLDGPQEAAVGDQIARVRLTDEPPQPLLRQARRQVDERPLGCGDRDAVDEHHIVRRGGPVHVDPSVVRRHPAWLGDLDHPVVVPFLHAMQHRGGRMADARARTNGLHRRDEPPAQCQRRPTHGVDAAVLRVEVPGADAVQDGVGRQPTARGAPRSRAPRAASRRGARRGHQVEWWVVRAEAEQPTTRSRRAAACTQVAAARVTEQRADVTDQMLARIATAKTARPR